MLSKQLAARPVALLMQQCRSQGLIASSTNVTTYLNLSNNSRLEQRCWYRGDTGEATPTLSPKEMELLSKAQPKSEEIRAKHTSPVTLDSIPNASMDSKILENPDTEKVELEIRRKRLIYRSKQRGWMEVDVLLGTWASKNVPDLDSEELDEFEEFVNMETIDIYNVITLRVDIPESLKEKKRGIVERIQTWAKKSPLGKADPEEYKTVKTDSNLI